jgi:glutamate racemase
MKIGFFDSGVGGLSVLNEAWHELPADTEYLFYCDSDHVPYGAKTRDEIRHYADEAVGFLFRQGADAVVVACNTATAVAISALRKKYTRPIIGMEPAVKPAVEESEGRRILTAATPVTVREEKLKKLLARVDSGHCVDLIPLPQLVLFAENENFDTPEVETSLRDSLKEYRLEDYFALVLGCTHFNYFKPVFRKIFGEQLIFVDGRHGTIRHLKDVMGLAERETGNSARVDCLQDLTDRFHTVFFISGRPVEDRAALEHFMRLLNRLEDVRSV